MNHPMFIRTANFTTQYSLGIIKCRPCYFFNFSVILFFGPLSVLPEYQRQGIGQALIRTMIEKAKKLGYGAILFFGRPEYYPQFGFKEAVIYGISDAEGYSAIYGRSPLQPALLQPF
mgnify:CR=1 FL=1